MVLFRSLDHYFSNRELCYSEKKYLKDKIPSTELKICNKFIEPELLDGSGDGSYCNDYDSDPETGYNNKKRINNKSYPRNNDYHKKYVISIFGRNEKGDSVCCHVIDYTPVLYVLIPLNFEKKPELFQQKFISHLKFGNYRFDFKHKGKILNSEIVERQIFQGFRNGKKNTFLKMYFNNISTRNKYYKYITSNDFLISGYIKGALKVYDYNVSTTARFFHDNNIPPQVWLKINKMVDLKHTEKFTNCDYEFSVFYKDLDYEKSKIDIVPTCKLAFDIETAPKKRRKGHPELNKGDPVIQIGLSFIVNKSPINLILTLNKSEKSDKSNFYIIECKDEKALILKFVDILRKGPINGSKKWAPDYIFSYNGNNFDWNYIYQRAIKLDIVEELDRVSKIINLRCLFYENKQVSKGMGTVTNSYPIHPGIVNIDILKTIEKMQITDMNDLKLKTACDYFLLDNKYGYQSILKYYKNKIDEYKSEKYEKDLFTTEYIKYLNKCFEDLHSKKEESNDAKIDLSYEDMYIYYFDSCDDPDSEESKKKIKTIADYCIRDCEVLHKLSDKLSVIMNFESRANLCLYPMKYVLTRGVNGINFHLTSYFTQLDGFLHPDVKYDQEIFEKPFYNELKNNPDYKKFYDNLAYDAKGTKLSEKKTLDRQEKEKEKFLDRYRILGAIVFNPISGMYEFVSTLDVKSEYPSIIMTKNLSHDKIVINQSFSNIEGIEYEDLEWEGKNYHLYTEKKKDPWRNLKYKTKVVKAKSEEDEGIIVKVLKSLLNRRNEIRKNQKNMNKNSIEYMVADSEQLATKVFMNALYGTLSYTKSQLYLKDLGGCTTAGARRYLSLCKNIVEENFKGSKIIYGDTDSIFIKWTIPEEYKTNEEKFNYVWDISVKAQDFINETCHKMGLKYMTIELEKVFSKLFLFSAKKKYFGILHEVKDYNKGVLKIMGVKSKKRDSTKIEKFTAELTRYYILNNELDKIIPLIKSIFRTIYENEFGVEYFLKSARYKPPYATPDSIHHAIAVKKINEIDPGITIDANERVFYFYKRIQYKRGPRGGKIEPKKMDSVWPAMFHNNKITIDYKQYFNYLVKNDQDILCHILKIDISDMSENQKVRHLNNKFIVPEIEKYEDIYAPNGEHIISESLYDIFN